jgi:hypothetical protein
MKDKELKTPEPSNKDEEDGFNERDEDGPMTREELQKESSNSV